MKDDVKDSAPTTTKATNNNDKKLKTINPATEEVLNEYELISKGQLNYTVKKSKNAFLEWKEDIDKRADFLYVFAKEFRKNKENLAKNAITYYLRFIDELYHVIEDRFDLENVQDKKKFEKIKAKYKKISEEHGAQVKVYIIYPEMSHFQIFMKMQIFR
jgi:hypothetical protein